MYQRLKRHFIMLSNKKRQIGYLIFLFCFAGYIYLRVDYETEHYIFQPKSYVPPICTSTTSFGFVKVHKCGSDSLAALFMRLAEERNSSIVLPVGDWNIGWPYMPQKDRHYLSSLLPDGKFEIATLHMMYFRNIWKDMLKPDAKFIGVIRSPFSQYKSFFNYFNIGGQLHEIYNISIEDSLDIFLRNPYAYWNEKNKRIWKNPMLFDFNYQNIQSIDVFIKQLSESISLMLIADYMDESLVMLRRTFCWTLKDILMMTKNKSRRYKFSTSQEQKDEERRESLYKMWSSYDYILFEHFNNTLWEKISREVDFYEELAIYREYSDRVTEFCSVKHLKDESLILPETKFNSEVLINIDFCVRFKRAVIPYIRYLKQKYFQVKAAAHFYR